jgi:hypothetical protein
MKRPDVKARNDEIIALAQAQTPYEEIESRLGVDREYLKVIVSQARARGVDIPNYKRVRRTEVADRNAEIIRLAKSLTPFYEIQRRTKANKGLISAVISTARGNGESIPYYKKGTAARAAQDKPSDDSSMSSACRNYLNSEASKRGIGWRALASRLLETIATDKMIPAILDDGK